MSEEKKYTIGISFDFNNRIITLEEYGEINAKFDELVENVDHDNLEEMKNLVKKIYEIYPNQIKKINVMDLKKMPSTKDVMVFTYPEE